MLRLVVLKSGVSQKLFDFDGDFARIGSSSAADLQLATSGIEDDLFYLHCTTAGYEIERRAAGFSFTVNGVPAADRLLLREGDKVAFLDYIVVATYPGPEARLAVPGISEGVKMEAPDQPVRNTAPIDKGPEPAADKPRPRPVKGSDRPTVLIDSQSLPTPGERIVSEPQREPKEQDTDRVVVTPPLKPQPSRPAAKPRITPVYSLVGLSGQHKGKTFFIDTKEFTVGRDRVGSDLVIDHDEHGQPEVSISREHFVIYSTDEGLYLTDKRSRLRTLVNRKVIEPGQREFIAPEDIITIPAPSGEVKFRLCFAGQENFSPDKTDSGPMRTVLILAGFILLLIIVLVLLLR